MEYLAGPLQEESNQQTAVAFCGGITKGQTQSEADAMRQYFRTLESQREYPFSLGAVLLEQNSKNTVENIHNLALEMIESGLFLWGMENLESIDDYDMMPPNSVEQSES